MTRTIVTWACLGFFLLCGVTCLAGEPIHAPDFSQAWGGYKTSGEGLSLSADRTVKPGQSSSLRIQAQHATGFVTSPRFSIVPTTRCGGSPKDNMTYWSVQYYIKDRLQGGSWRQSLRILDGESPYEISFDHFGGTDTIVNGFTRTYKSLCPIATTHPNIRGSGGAREVELVLYLDHAQGDIWLSDVKILPAQRGGAGFSDAQWEAFETGDGIHYVTMQSMMLQPAYARQGDFCSELIMDTAYKLCVAAGFNQNREEVSWEDHFSRPDLLKPTIANTNPRVRVGGGNAQYRDSLQKLDQQVSKLRYYGIGSLLIIGGSPDWTHPGHHNNRKDGDHNGLSNPGNRNHLGDPYPGPQYADGGHWLYPPDDWQDYRDYVRALVSQLKGKVNAYEIINEINVAGQGAVIGGYKAVEGWVKHFFEVAKPIDPNADIIIGACDKMLAALVADGTLDYADGVAYHNYTGNLAEPRGIVEASGAMKHIWMTEHHGFHEDLMTRTRCQGRWTVFSVFAGKMDDHRLLELRDFWGNPVNATAPAGLGDRVAIVGDGLFRYGVMTGKLNPQDLAGRRGDRITAELVCPEQINYGDTHTVTLRAVNQTQTTFHQVRVWPVGFVDNLGFTFDQIRATDQTIAEFPPGQVAEISLRLQPITTRYQAGGTYDLGLVVVNAEGKHSLALRSVTVLDPNAVSASAPAISNSELRSSESALTYLTLQWSRAADENTRPEELLYEVYRSEQNNIHTAASARQNGLLIAALTDIQTCRVDNLTQGSENFFTVLVKNRAGRISAYQTASFQTMHSTDIQPPLPGSSGKITAQSAKPEEVLQFHDNPYPNDITLRWQLAEDRDGTARDKLTYRIYRSENDNLSTPFAAEKNGTLIASLTNAALYVAASNLPRTTYYFTIVVTDQAGNKALYQTVPFTTGQ